MRETTFKNKRLHELSFDDLYIEDDVEIYPNIKQALSKLKTKIKNRKNSLVHTGETEEELFELPVHGMHTRHLRHNGA